MPSIIHHPDHEAHTPEPLSPERLAEYRELAARIATDPWVLSDCEGWLKIWRESALNHVTRDETGEIDGFSEPSSHRVADLIVEIELDSWDPGEDATDDQRRADIGTMFTAREALAALLAEVARLKAVNRSTWDAHGDLFLGYAQTIHDLRTERDELKARNAELQESKEAGERVIVRMSGEARRLEAELVSRQERIAELADRAETAEARVAELERPEIERRVKVRDSLRTAMAEAEQAGDYDRVDSLRQQIRDLDDEDAKAGGR